MLTARRCAMKRKLASAVLVFAAAPGLLLAGQFHSLSGNGLLGWVATTTPPYVMCVGGTQTSETLPYCSAETQRILGFSEQQLWWPESLAGSGSDLLTGPITFEVNCSFDPAYRGPCWGTFSWEVPGGTWKGHWTAPTMDLATFESEIHMEGVGEGGDIDGVHLKLDGTSNPGDWYVAFHARLK
jgi:hypothetical protein